MALDPRIKQARALRRRIAAYQRQLAREQASRHSGAPGQVRQLQRRIAEYTAEAEALEADAGEEVAA